MTEPEQPVSDNIVKQSAAEPVYPQQSMVRVDGKPFRCECGCNVFTQWAELRYRCNGCDASYIGER